jgi:hypothetical protein
MVPVTLTIEKDPAEPPESQWGYCLRLAKKASRAALAEGES